MAWTFCTSGSAVNKAGANANSDIIVSGSVLQVWSNQAEATICVESNYNWIDNYSDLDSNLKHILGEAASARIANNIINYDMGGYSGKREAETMLDVNRDIYKECLSLLSKSNQDIIK